MGYDLALTRAAIAPIRARMLAAVRRAGFYVFHTREGHRADLSDLPANKRVAVAPDRRGHRRPRAVRADTGPRRSGAGRSFPSWPPGRANPIIDKPGKGAFYATDLELLLRLRGVAESRSSPASPRTSACIRPCARPTTAASSACCWRTAAALPTMGNHLAAIKMIKMQGGVFGSVATSAALIACVE